MNNTQFFKVVGVVSFIGDTLHIPREKAKDLYKKVLTIKTFDGQVLYPEIRDNKIKQLEEEYIHTGLSVELEVSFQGSEKNGKRYNNIYINSIKRIS